MVGTRITYQVQVSHTAGQSLPHTPTPLFHKVGHIALQAQKRPRLALGPLGAPEHESMLNRLCLAVYQGRVPLPTFSCSVYQLYR